MQPPKPPISPLEPTLPSGHAAQHLQRVMRQAMGQFAAAQPALGLGTVPQPQAAATDPSPSTARIGVALSGGADSSAVLLAAVQHWPGRVQAVHIHHGLQAAADGFAAHCAALCERLRVPLTVLRVQAQAKAGESPEAKAREARYLALAQWARGDAQGLDEHHALPLATPRLAPHEPVAVLLLGHHADDQVESVLLALSRGAGVAGLAGMGAQFERHGARFARPLLQVAADDIRSWLRTQGLNWVEDPSNTDPRFTRNRIRQLLPALYGAFPSFRQTLARSAQLCAQASELLDAQAELDLAQVCGDTPAQPQIQRLQALSPERQAQALRHWLRHTHHTTPSQAQLKALLQQVAACRTRGHHIDLRVGHGQLQRQGDALVWRRSAR